MWGARAEMNWWQKMRDAVAISHVIMNVWISGSMNGGETENLE